MEIKDKSSDHLIGEGFEEDEEKRELNDCTHESGSLLSCQLLPERIEMNISTDEEPITITVVYSSESLSIVCCKLSKCCELMSVIEEFMRIPRKSIHLSKSVLLNDSFLPDDESFLESQSICNSCVLFIHLCIYVKVETGVDSVYLQNCDTLGDLSSYLTKRYCTKHHQIATVSCVLEDGRVIAMNMIDETKIISFFASTPSIRFFTVQLTRILTVFYHDCHFLVSDKQYLLQNNVDPFLHSCICKCLKIKANVILLRNKKQITTKTVLSIDALFDGTPIMIYDVFVPLNKCSIKKYKLQDNDDYSRSKTLYLVVDWKDNAVSIAGTATHVLQESEKDPSLGIYNCVVCNDEITVYLNEAYIPKVERKDPYKKVTPSSDVAIPFAVKENDLERISKRVDTNAPFAKRRVSNVHGVAPTAQNRRGKKPDLVQKGRKPMDSAKNK